jgi:hypothetical protein
MPSMDFYKPLYVISAVIAAWICPPVWGQSDAELRRLDELDAACTRARAAKLRVVQQQKIEECVNETPEHRAARKSRKDCEAYWGDYGWTTGTASGGARPHLYGDLPECVRAFEARQQYRAR